jgi:CheY-like chemotaxis protein
VNKGSTFHIYWPLTRESDTQPEVSTVESLPKGNERILWVDDEKVLVDMGQEMFSRLGYHVTTTTRSKDALELFRRHHDRFDLVITDMTMPEVTGLQLSRKLVDIKSDIDVILCSGYSEEVTLESLAKAGIREYIAKPFNHAQIATVIRRVLDRKIISLPERAISTIP